jgi:predicted RND superfamily exporter protein
MSLPYGLDLNNQIDIDKASTRIVVSLKNITSVNYLDLEERVKAWLDQNALGYEYKMASPQLMFSHIGQRNIKSMLVGTSIAIVLISLVLAIALRSAKFGVLSLLPNLAPVGIGFGLWYFIDGEVGLALSAVAGMTLGIVVDYTVHFLSKYLRARREHDCDSIEAVRYAFASVGRALWTTTFVLVAGFLILAQSSFKQNADIGLLTAITIFTALVIDFFFLPAVVMKIEGGKEQEGQSA